MSLFRRVPSRASTTPVFDGTARATFWPALVKVAAVPAIAVALLAWFGQPALRIQYWYHGTTSAPVYDRCLYLSAFSGWHDRRVTPFDGDDPCPVIDFLPITDWTFGVLP
ncbi:hypothetical protein MWN34_10885 [Ancylobacter sp. 6x-1]|uniref:Uncharacterized protein n=1 Tax=Ancylobacter crimeensis TaxID=2579147 RepID=A0ABT0DBS8_9HYPH|nr:hypothetical protein [Ancylobacter crimeensis]MCK0197418.1 hypothetical protein [Ancylobacter crimeensis]